MDQKIVLKISEPLLRKLLKLPDDAAFDAFSKELFFSEGCVAIRVESRSYPERHENHAAPVAVPFLDAQTGALLGWYHPSLMKEMDFSPDPFYRGAVLQRTDDTEPPCIVPSKEICPNLIHFPSET